VWYAGYFYIQFFLERVLKVDAALVNWLLIGAVLVSAPLYVFFGWLSDKVGRKPVMLFGMILALVAFFPGFHALTRAANPALAEAQASAPVTVIADPAGCNLQFDPVGKATFSTACDIAKSTLAKQGVSYVNEPAAGTGVAMIKVGETIAPVPTGERLPKAELAALRTKAQGEVTTVLRAAGYPEKADPAKTNAIGLFFTLLVLATGATALYGPQAAALVEMFPARVRYTALSLPYHIGTGWVGGILPAAA